MRGKALHKLDYGLAIAELAIIVVGTIVAGVLGGLRLAGLVGFLLFIFLDGLSCIWTVLTHTTTDKIHGKLDEAEQARFDERTRNNPTLR